MITHIALVAVLPTLLAWQTSPVTTSGTYTPTIAQCPDGSWEYVRPASSGLSIQETDWLSKRQASIVPALQTYLEMVNIKGFDTAAYISALNAKASDIPVIGVAVSGGGYRAEMCAFGLYQAMDGRYPAALQAGTGGLLQAVTYWSGLSGGSETTFALGFNGFPTLESMVQNHQMNSTIDGALFEQMKGKAELGFGLNAADFYGITLLQHFAALPASPHVDPLSWTWSGLQVQDAFSNGSTPMPIIMTVEVIPEGVKGSVPLQTPNGTIFLPNPEYNTVYEFNPFEFGSWTGRVQAFSDLQYLGTNMSGGYTANAAECVTGYDTGVFVGGAGVCALNLWLAQNLTNGTVQFAKRDHQSPVPLAKRQNQRGPNPPFIPYPPNEARLEELAAAYASAGQVAAIPEYLKLTHSTLEEFLYASVPNPFYGYGDGVDSGAMSQDRLYLVDGSETGQEIPIWPLIQPARRMDFLIASDNGGTELLTGWANGTNFRNTARAAKREGIPFPKLPSVNTMLNMGYTSEPTFFGCNEPNVPLVLYVADFPYSAYTNISTFEGLTDAQVRLVAANGLALLSQDGGNLSPGFPQCIACGVIWRSLERMGQEAPEFCKKCMKDHCWQGQVNDASPSYLQPALVLQPNLTWAEWNATVYNA